MDPYQSAPVDEAETGSDMIREQPDVPEARKRLVSSICDEVNSDKAHWKADFERMKDDMRFARNGGLKSWKNSGKYTANITQRHVRSKVAALYAKDPRVVVKRKQRMDFKIWDGDTASLQMAQQAMAPEVMMSGMVPPEMIMQAQQTLQDAAQGLQRRKLLESVGRTLEILMSSQLSEQNPPFKRRMKTAVRHTVVCGVGYVKLGFQRLYEMQPETAQRIAEIETRLGTIEQLMKDIQDGEKNDSDPEAEELRQTMAALQAEPEILSREGLVWDFPASTAIIPHRRCHTLQGFLGGDWVTEEFMMSPDDVKSIWGVDLAGATYRSYTMNGAASKNASDSKKPKDHQICVWQNYNRRQGLVYTLVDGYCDFLEEPGAPGVRLERFYPWFALTFNELEDDETIYPPSDVSMLKPMQNDYNRARQSLREHRHANRPKYAVPKGMLSTEDKAALQSHPANAIIELNALQSGQKVDDVLQAIRGVPIDQTLYDVSGIFDDFQRVGGSQEANLGGMSKGTATESSIAENSRMSDLSSNHDDLDDLLAELFREAGQVALTEFSAEQVTQICGEGAVWPEWTASEIAGELYLSVEAGSSGRPNKTIEIQNFKEIAPILLQIPGIKPEAMAKEGIRRMDDRLDILDMLDPMQPAILAMNKMAQASTGDPATDPNQQGDKGGNNAKQPPGSEAPPPAPGTPQQMQGGAAGGIGPSGMPGM